MNIDVEFYELPDGNEPAREFLDGLDRKMCAKMYREIDLLVMTLTYSTFTPEIPSY